MQFLNESKSQLISQLIKDISRALQKLLRYFNGTIISTSVQLLSPVLSVIFYFILNESIVALFALKSTILPLAAFIADSSLQYCHKIPEFF